MTNDSAQTVIELDRVVKHFGAVTAVKGVSLQIAEGEFFSLLGPSGCGKTTTLRMLAGFETPTEGRILLQGTDVTGVPPNRREVNMVFQNYALFPHLDVADNVAYGLRRESLPENEIEQRVSDILDLVHLPRGDFGNRRPMQLSGGQQQRVALARALIKRPKALLLDEPLGALDLKLRRGMQLELKSMQHELGITFVYVTHDQEEALTMSDRIAVMDGGEVVQVGGAREIYQRPRTRFVADFIGISNIVELPVARRHDDAATLAAPSAEDRVAVHAPDLGTSDVVVFSIRPENLSVVDASAAAEATCRLTGTVRSSAFLGSSVQYQVGVPQIGDLLATAPANAPIREPGEEAVLVWEADMAVLLTDETSTAAADGTATDDPPNTAGTP